MKQMKHLFSRNKTVVLFAVLISIWTLFLLPAVLFNQWFTLDMGGVFTNARGFPGNLMLALMPDTLFNQGGRYFPVYWLYNFIVFWLFSTHFAAHFAAQCALFIISLTLTCYLFLRVTDSLKATFIFGFIACLGGAVAENLYTVGKGEPLAYLFLVSILLIFYTTNLKHRNQSALPLASMSVLFSFAIWSKETSIVLLGLGPAAIVISLILSMERIKTISANAHVSRYLLLSSILVAGFLIAKAPSQIFSIASVSKNYVDYKIDLELVTENLLFYAAQQPDVLFFGVASLFLCGITASRIRLRGDGGLPKVSSDLIFVTGLLLVAWSYYLGMLLWRWPMGYYMLLPSIIFKFATMYGLVFAHKNRMLIGKGILVAVLAVLTCGIYAFIHSSYVMTSQISYSRMYTEAVSKYVLASTPSNRLVVESFPFYAEQVTNTKQLISIIYGEKRVIDGIADLLNPEVVTPKIVKLLNISQKQLDDNEKALPSKNDYLLLMTGNKLATWSVRGVTPHFSEDSLLKKIGAYDLIPIAENKLSYPSAFLNIWTDSINVGSTYLGYKLYKISGDRAKVIWKNRHPDGWIGKTASLRVFPEYGDRALVTVSTPSFNSPNRLTVTQDHVITQRLDLIAGKELSFEITIDGGTVPTNLQFAVDSVAVPKKLKINKDKRELGVLIRLEHYP